ncbi:MAG: hypothetical protein JWO08_3683 [Verrucomicrobiaceae bacterium]|nr:hypothetical protein [Verrucomicrobiaceae bacterium]
MVSEVPPCLSSPLRWLLYWLVLLAIVIGLQNWHGAYRSDLGGDPDEAAHAVTSLMVRDYLTQGLGQHPMRFAEAYYARFPKVALGHYPPGFYVLAGVWLLPFASIGSLLVLHAVLIATLGLITTWCALRLMPCALAVIAGLLTCASAPMEKIAVLVMSDVLVAIFCLLSAIAFASYMERPRVTAASAFGFAAAFAILTKGSGWMLALLPPLAIALAGRWKLLLKPSLWVAPLPVILLALPWQLFSYKMTEGGMSGLTPMQHFKIALPFYTEAAIDSFGIPLLMLLVCGLSWQVYHSVLKRQGAAPMAASVWAMFLAGWVLALTIPAGTSSRYFIPITMPFVVFALRAAWKGAQSFLKPLLAQGAATIAICTSLAIGLSHKDLNKDVHGFHETVQQITNAPGVTLVCADSRGEGALVADAAFDPTLRATKDFSMLRATKELSSQDWIGRGYTLAFQNDEALLDYLKKRNVRKVLLDDSVTGTYRQPHFDQLKRTLSAPGSAWQITSTLPVTTGTTGQGSMLIFTSKP